LIQHTISTANRVTAASLIARWVMLLYNNVAQLRLFRGIIRGKK